MDHRQRIISAIQHLPVDRIPTDLWATVEVQEKLFSHLQIETARGVPSLGVELMGGLLSRDVSAILELFSRLDIDGILALKPPYIGPTPIQRSDYWENEWGMGFRAQPYEGGHYNERIRYPLAEAETIADLQAFRWPNPDWYDYSALPDIARRCGGRALSCGYFGIFFYHNLLRGLELSMLDLVTQPAFTHYLIERLTEFFNEYHRRCFTALKGMVDMTQVTDDYGAQKGLLISPRSFDEFYRSPMQSAIDLARSFGLQVFHHDDGDMRRLLPRLLDMGITVLNPIQWRCGNWDLAAMKAEFGSRVCFHSAIDNQQTLAFGTPDDVRNEVRQMITFLASDKTGYIVGPCHNLQAVSSVENILALYQAAREFGSFTV